MVYMRDIRNGRIPSPASLAKGIKIKSNKKRITCLLHVFIFVKKSKKQHFWPVLLIILKYLLICKIHCYTCDFTRLKSLSLLWVFQMIIMLICSELKGMSPIDFSHTMTILIIKYNINAVIAD